MIKSYLILGIRNLFRNATTTAINIVGLSIAMGCAITIFILEDSFYNLDAMHENGDRIGLLVNHFREGNDIRQWATSPALLSELLKENSRVETTVRACRGQASVKAGEKIFTEGILFASSDFLNAFSFKLVKGSREVLTKKSQLALTREMAAKYFGNEDIIGQTISIKFNIDYKLDFTVGAILENTPANSSMYFNFLIPVAAWDEINKSQLQDWSKNTMVTFVMIKENQSFDQLQSSLDIFKKYQNEANPFQPLSHTEVVPLPKVAERSYQINDSLSISNFPAGNVALIVIGIFLLLLACLNYMNVAVASVSTRLKEIGVRKVIGGGKIAIIQQFLIENTVICFFALSIGVLLAYYLLLPGYDALVPFNIAFEISSWQTAVFFFGGLLLFVALISGAYPSLYVSSFNAVKILRGKEKFGAKSKFSRALLTVQFTLSITVLVGCLVFISAGSYFEAKGWGYDKSSIVAVPLVASAQYEELFSSIKADKNVVLHAGAKQHIGKSSEIGNIKYKEQEFSVVHFPVGFHYLELMGFRLKSGRFFNEDAESDKIESVIVNETFVKKMGWQNPLLESFECNGTKRYVTGVIKDFNYNFFFFPVEPVIVTITRPEEFQYLVVKTETAAAPLIKSSLEKTWRHIAPDDPYRGVLQSEVFHLFTEGVRTNNKIVIFISAISVLLASMGLYGLVSYNLTRRLKEFSVRKVFGATVFQLLMLMKKDFTKMLIIAFIVGVPLGTYLMKQVLQTAYHETIPIYSWPYIVSAAVIAIIVSATILSQLRRVVTENPVNTLKGE